MVIAGIVAVFIIVIGILIDLETKDESWHNIDICKECRHKLEPIDDFNECCPYCGAKDKTFDSPPKDKVTIRYVRIKGFPPTYIMEGHDDKAKEWIDKYAEY